VSSSLDKFRDLLVGAVVVAVDDPDEGVTEAIARFVVRKGAEKHEFHLHATDLGWWVGGHQSTLTGPEGHEITNWPDFSNLIDAITDHLVGDHLDDWEDSEVSSLEPLADPRSRRIGFRCKVTGKDWWASISTASGFVAVPHIKDALTKPEGREAVADFLGIYHRLPNPEELTA
jgi:hypothetical protein